MVNDSRQRFLDKVKKYREVIADFDITDEEIEKYIIDIHRIIKIIELCNTSNSICGADGFHFKLTKDSHGNIYLKNFICPKNKNNVDFMIKNNIWYISNNIKNDFQKLRKEDIFTENEFNVRNKFINFLLNIKRSKIIANGCYLQGNFSTGKSYILTAFCNDMALMNKSIIYISMNSFSLDIMKSFQELNSFKNDIVDQMLEVDILVLDDLGSDVFKDVIHTQIIYPILSYRLNANKLTLFSSRYSINELRKIYRNNGNKQVEQLIDKISRISSTNLFNINTNKRINS